MLKIASLRKSKNTNVTEDELIDGCRQNNKKAQKLLWDKYAARMFGVCKRYVKSRENAEDVMITGMCKAMTKIDSYSGKGRFEGWIRRIVVNEALMFLRKTNNFRMTVEMDNNIEMPSHVTVEDEMAAQDILNLLDKLPTGYRTVFNLFVIEGYKHKEIAVILDISINTSKSQLIHAKKKLVKLIKENKYRDVETG